MASSSVDHRYKFDAFLSFRGEDIRKSFMDHLFSNIKRKGMFPFRDDRELRFGDKIDGGLEESITKSRVVVVIFTQNYASSTWCLNELVQILEYNETEKDQYHVRALFYNVERSLVKEHGGNYKKHLDKHGSRESPEQVNTWKKALAKGADLPGWEFNNIIANKFDESAFTDKVSKDIFEMLSKDGPLDLGENLVGLDSCAEKMNLLQFVNQPSKVHMVGICGTSDVGKTTTARAIYNLLHIQFDGCSFCEDVKGMVKMYGLTYVQNQLIDDITTAGDELITSVGQGITVIKKIMRSKKVLIILDDVSNSDQMKALAGSPTWFTPGSLIIVTCNDRQLLRANGVKNIFELLVQNESLVCMPLILQFIMLMDTLWLSSEFMVAFFLERMQLWSSEVEKLKSYNTLI